MRRGSQGTGSRWGRRLPWSPPRIIAVYLVLGLAWIAFSDRALEALVRDAHALSTAQTVKGWAFVVLTSLLLFVLIRRGERAATGLGAEVRATVDSMVDAVLLVDESGRIVEANQAACELLAVGSKEQILGPIEDWARRFQLRSLDGAPVPRERFASLRALAGERVTGYEAVLRRADGRDAFVSVAATPVHRPDAPRLAVAVLRDVSQARRLDELRDEFLATAAHEFKTPLAVVKAYAQLMERRDPSERQALTVIQRQVDRLTRMVQHLLDTSRLRGGAGEGRRDRFDLSALATEVVDRMRPAAPGHDLRVETGGPAPVVVVADRDRIASVLASLLDNAVRYSPAGGPVRTRVDVADREALVSVQDRGLGIPQDRQARIFERYYRAHAGTPDDYGGLGLGLEMSREIVRLHGGRMWFESAPGSGSTFHFSLPLAEEAS